MASDKFVDSFVCHFCEAESGWYDKRVASYRQFFDEYGNSDGYASFSVVRGGTRKFCAECNKDVTRAVEIFMMEVRAEESIERAKNHNG